MMEEKVFPSPAVASELRGWVEARLHTDGPPREEENRTLQERLTKASGERSVATVPSAPATVSGKSLSRQASNAARPAGAASSP